MQFGLIGKTLSHSYSAEIHKSIGGYEYALREIEPEKLGDFFKERSFSGINVTIPYKEAVIPYLDEISAVAKKIGAVNTIVNKNGRLLGYNTDFAGMKALFERNKIVLKDKKVVILGTGGTSKTAFAVSESLIAREIIFVSRTPKQNAITYDELYDKHKDVQVIINTTPVGMFPNVDEAPVRLDNFTNLEAVADVIYNPLRSNLLLLAKERKIPYAGGLYMLSAQAVYASSLFTGKDANEEKIFDAYRNVLRQKENIILIGMPSCGKSTIGKMLAASQNMDFVDSDNEIITKTGLPISEFFKKYGEAEFRKIEKEAIAVLSKRNGTVIATGGGAVLDRDNVRALQRNGIIIFLNRSLKNLIPTSDRPLSSDYSALENMFKFRLPIYKAVADIEVLSNSAPENVTKDIIKELSK